MKSAIIVALLSVACAAPTPTPMFRSSGIGGWIPSGPNVHVSNNHAFGYTGPDGVSHGFENLEDMMAMMRADRERIVAQRSATTVGSSSQSSTTTAPALSSSSALSVTSTAPFVAVTTTTSTRSTTSAAATTPPAKVVYSGNVGMQLIVGTGDRNIIRYGGIVVGPGGVVRPADVNSSMSDFDESPAAGSSGPFNLIAEAQRLTDERLARERLAAAASVNTEVQSQSQPKSASSHPASSPPSKEDQDSDMASEVESDSNLSEEEVDEAEKSFDPVDASSVDPKRMDFNVWFYDRAAKTYAEANSSPNIASIAEEIEENYDDAIHEWPRNNEKASVLHAQAMTEYSKFRLSPKQINSIMQPVLSRQGLARWGGPEKDEFKAKFELYIAVAYIYTQNNEQFSPECAWARMRDLEFKSRVALEDGNIYRSVKLFKEATAKYEKLEIPADRKATIVADLKRRYPMGRL